MSKNFFDGSDVSGSPDDGSGVPNEKLGETQDNNEGKDTNSDAGKIDEKQYKELESLVGRQGKELGELRKFFGEISPLLEKLDNSPELVQAIVDGNLTSELAKAAIEGKISVQDAKVVSKAQDEVKSDLGKNFSKTSTEDINKLIEVKAREINENLQKELKERDDLNNFESQVNDFISRTPDFKDYAPEIDKWLDNHDVTDIAVAYYAVKGELSEKEAKKKAENEAAELQKENALNMSGGGSSIKGRKVSGEDIVDSLVANKSNPNIF